ncbi:MAG: hypothetical protein KJ847_05340 [Firmicutes bacterium]|nr:hypothetical protein [Bacillota bacterium]
MKRKVAIFALIVLSIFSLIALTGNSKEVFACGLPLPDADTPQPCNN